MDPQSLCVGPANSRAFGVFQRTTPVTARCTVLSFCQKPAQIPAEEFPRLLWCAVFPTVLVQRITTGMDLNILKSRGPDQILGAQLILGTFTLN